METIEKAIPCASNVIPGRRKFPGNATEDSICSVEALILEAIANAYKSASFDVNTNHVIPNLDPLFEALKIIRQEG